MSVMSTGALRSGCAVNSPPKPEPMMTTRGRPLAEPFAAGTGAGDVVMMFPSSHLGRVPLLLGRSDPGHSRRYPPTRAFRAVPLVTMDVAYVFVPGLGLDERSSGALRRLVVGRVVLLPGMGLAEPVPPLDLLAARLLAEVGEG